MDFNPPIKERSDKELLEIIENRDEWEPEATNQAQSELISRGISLDTQDNHRRSKKKYKSRIKKIKSSSSYSNSELLLLIIFGWPLCLIFMDLNFFYSGKGFSKKNRQGIAAAFLGMLFWAFVIYLIVLF